MKRIILMCLYIIIHMFFSKPAFCAFYESSNPTPWSWGIVSDFGPRMMSTWDFHEGIDYSAAPGDQDLGTPIPAVESGDVSFILSRGSFYNINIIGDTTHSEWLYGHIFQNNNRSINEIGSDKVWEWMSATLVDPNNLNNTSSGNIIVLWTDSTRTTADKVLSTIGNSNRRIRLGFENGRPIYIIRQDGTPILTRGHVNAGESIAPMGNANSTYVPVHLHLGLNYPNDNPLQYLQHGSYNYTFQFLEPPSSFTQTEAYLKAIRVRIKSGVDRDTNGLEGINGTHTI